MAKFVEVSGGAISAIYDSRHNNVPEGALFLNDEDFEEIRKAGGAFSLFDYVGGRAVLSDRSPPDIRIVTEKTELQSLIDIVSEIIEVLPSGATDGAAEKLRGLSARLSQKSPV